MGVCANFSPEFRCTVRRCTAPCCGPCRPVFWRMPFFYAACRFGFIWRCTAPVVRRRGPSGQVLRRCRRDEGRSRRQAGIIQLHRRRCRQGRAFEWFKHAKPACGGNATDRDDPGRALRGARTP